MTTPPAPQIQTEFRCAQCSGVLHPDEGQAFLTCPYCNSTVYLDKSKVVFHWAVACTVMPEAAAGNLRRWMASNHTVKDLDRKSTIVASTFQYFPVWYVKARKDGKEKIYLQPAAATSVSEIKALDIPAGDLQKYDPSLDDKALAPSVPFPAMLTWLTQERNLPASQVAEAALVHLPMYIFKYQFQGQQWTALVEGASGKVLANLFPAKAETPYFMVAGAATLGFLFISLFPVLGYLFGEEAGVGLGLVACAIGMAVYAIPIFVLAAWVSAKV